jgi:hypothetical protein
MIFTSAVFEKVQSGPGTRRWWPLIDRIDYGDGVCLFTHVEGRGIPVSEFPEGFSEEVQRLVQLQVDAGAFGDIKGNDVGIGTRNYGLEIHTTTDATPIAIQKDSEAQMYSLTFMTRVARRDDDAGQGGNWSDNYWMVGQVLLSLDEAFDVACYALAEQLVRKFALSYEEYELRKREVLEPLGLYRQSSKCLFCSGCGDLAKRREEALRPHNLDSQAGARQREGFMRQFSEAYGEAADPKDPIRSLFVWKDSISPPK